MMMMISWNSVITLLAWILPFCIKSATGFAPAKNFILSTAQSVYTTSSTKSSCLWYQEQDNSNKIGSSNDGDAITATSSQPTPPPIEFTSPVLQQLYPNLLQHKEEYGHPNIPLGSSPGRQCNTVRRLHIQNKLQQEEIDWLNEIGFTFHSLEDVYKIENFDKLFDRMMTYENNHPESNFQIPKKCVEDPELGAWVTGIRRLGPDGVNPTHERKLNSVQFAWKSTRKCGSKFMKQYREYVAWEVANNGNKTIDDLMKEDPKVVKWVQAQQEALKRGGLSQTRVHYMEQLFGENWTTIGKPI